MAITKVVKNSKRGATKGERRGGRQKGTPNKKTLDFVEALGTFDPVEELKNICCNTDKDDLKAHICLNLLKYIYPQRKAIELDTSNIPMPEVNIKGI